MVNVAANNTNYTNLVVVVVVGLKPRKVNLERRSRSNWESVEGSHAELGRMA